MSPMEQLAKQEYERGYSDGKSDFFAAGVAEGEMRARQRMIANRVAANQDPFAASGKPIDHIADAGKVIAEPVNTRSCSEYSEVKQEPVAIVVEVDRHGDATVVSGAWQLDGGTHTFYAAPVSAKREWVDLTDDELKAALEVHQVGLSVRIGRIAIAAFKEKNK